MIAIFGGVFNPPTVAHYEVAKHLLSLSDITSLLFVPVGDQYEKAGLIPAFHRVKMLEIMISDLPHASVSKVEVEADRKLKTMETLEKLQTEYAGETLAFVIGADNLKDLTGWYNYKQLITKFNMIIINRGELNVYQLIKDHFQFASDHFLVVDDFLKIDISSTAYRNDLTRSDLLRSEVEAYIKKYSLYRTNHD